MTSSLYNASVPQYLQLLPGAVNSLAKAETWAREKQLSSKEMLGNRLAPDMLPLSVQFVMAAGNSGGAIRALTSGLYQIPTAPPPTEFDEVRALLTDALAAVQAVTPEQIEAARGNTIAIEFQGRTVMQFAADDYLLSFALPNFYFHTVTAYGILRNLGLSIGKTDYLGTMRLLPQG